MAVSPAHGASAVPAVRHNRLPAHLRLLFRRRAILRGCLLTPCRRPAFRGTCRRLPRHQSAVRAHRPHRRRAARHSKKCPCGPRGHRSPVRPGDMPGRTGEDTPRPAGVLAQARWCTSLSSCETRWAETRRTTAMSRPVRPAFFRRWATRREAAARGALRLLGVGDSLSCFALPRRRLSLVRRAKNYLEEGTVLLSNRASPRRRL